MMHIYCNFRPGDENTDWFEETLCQKPVPSSCAAAWPWGGCGSARIPTGSDYSKAMANYAQTRINERKLPQDHCHTLAELYRRHAAALPAAKHRDARKLYLTMATELLPLFEAHPEAWRAVEYLNAEKLRPETHLRGAFKIVGGKHSGRIARAGAGDLE